MKRIFSLFIVFSVFTITVYAQNINWQQTNGPFGGYVRGVAYDANGNLFAGISGGIYKSTNDGENWTLCSASIGNPYIYSIAASPNGTIFAGTLYDDIYRSTDEGNTWTKVGFNFFVIDAIAIKSDGTIFAAEEESDGSGNGSVYRSTDNGDTWTEVNSGLPNAAVWQIRIDNNGYVFAANIYGVYRSTNNGASWTQLTNGLPIIVSSDIAINPLNNYIYASGYVTAGYAVFRSTDGGDSFTQLTFPITVDAHTLGVSPAGHLFIGGTQTYPYYHVGVYRSTDDGETFTETDTSVSITNFAFNSSGQISGGSYLGVHHSSDDGNNWELKVSGMNGIEINVMAADNVNNIFAGTRNGPYRSTDSGNTWEQPGNSNRLRSVRQMAATSNGYIFLITDNNKVYRSTDGGSSWSELSISVLFGILFAAPNDYIYLGSAYDGIYRSTDYGETWTEQNTGLPPTIFIEDFTSDASGKIYTATETSGIWQSSDNGDSWSAFSSYTGYIDHIASNNAGDLFWIYSHTGSNYYRLYRSTDHGSTYTQLTIIPGHPGVAADLLISPDQKIYVALSDDIQGGVYRSDDNGDNFEMTSDGLTENQFTSLSLDSQEHLLAGTTRGIFRAMQAVPVELSSFNAFVSGSEVLLKWETASETNNKGFEIQRSEVRDQKSYWEEIGFVAWFRYIN